MTSDIEIVDQRWIAV